VRRFGHWDSPLQVSQIAGLGATELYVRVRSVEPRGDLGEQARDLYRQLGALLQSGDLAPQDVITEKVFFSDLEAQVGEFRQVRAAFYGKTSQPATTYLHQPSCRPGTLCELQARVIFANGPDPVQVRDLEADLGAGRGKVVSCRGYDHIYLHNLTGDKPGFGSQMEEILARAAAALEAEGLRFPEAIRTWIYLAHMERDYHELNRVRSAFFARQGVRRLPASTGIQGGVYPPDRSVGLDLYALRAARPAPVEALGALTMNEAPAYGSSFSRGLAVTREDQKVVYVSGTASIDDCGQVVHRGDIRGQVHRMLTNVEQVLASAGARLGDAVRATTYLKDPGDFDCAARICVERGLPDIPHTLCRAEVCRPEWLCEIELVAVLEPEGR